MTLVQILARLAAISGGSVPTVRIPYWVAYAFGVASTGWATLTGQEPRAPLDAVRMARKKMFVSHEKAKRALGFDPGPVDDALRRAVDWFRANGYV
jgi:dihydroflavonol-4-reductase